MKVVLMPRLRLLTQLDQEGLYEFNAPQMREFIRPHAEEYRRVGVLIGARGDAGGRLCVAAPPRLRSPRSK